MNTMKFLYTNWRGETAIRTVYAGDVTDPITVAVKTTHYHGDAQPIMRAFDLDRNDYRDFALADCDFTICEVAETNEAAE